MLVNSRKTAKMSKTADKNSKTYAKIKLSKTSAKTKRNRMVD